MNIDKCSYASMPEALEGKENQENYKFEKIDITNSHDINKIFLHLSQTRSFTWQQKAMLIDL